MHLERPFTKSHQSSLQAKEFQTLDPRKVWSHRPISKPRTQVRMKNCFSSCAEREPGTVGNSSSDSTDTSQNLVADVSELSLRAISPASSNHRGSHCSQVCLHLQLSIISDGRHSPVSVHGLHLFISVVQEPLQRSVSVEDQRSGTSSKTIFNELMDTLKLLEQEPQQLCQPMIQQKEKYAWIDEVRICVTAVKKKKT